MSESIIQTLCKIPVLVNSNVSQHLLPILFLYLWEHNTIATHKVEDNVRQPYRHPRKRTISTLSLFFQIPNQEHPRSFGMNSTSVTVTRLCMVFSLLTTLSNCAFQYLHVYRTAKIQAQLLI